MLPVPGLPYRELLAPPVAPLPVPFDRPADFFLRGSTALWRGLRLFDPRPGNVMLFPAFHCGIELDVVLRAGFQVEFYDVDADFRIDVDTLRRRAGPDVHALYVIHYFGRAHPLRDLQRLCAEREWILIEDCAHALLSRGAEGPVGTTGDLAFFCPHKTLPIPTAGVLRVNDRELDRTVSRGSARTRRPPPGYVTRAVLELLGRDVVRSGPMRWAVTRRWLDAMGRRMRAGVTLGPTSDHPAIRFRAEWEDASAPPLTQWLVRRTCRPEVAARRRAHFAALLDALAGCRRIRPMMRAIEPGDCPIALPVLVDDGRARLIAFCEQRGVRIRGLWPVVHPALPVDRHPEAVRWKREIVTLPVHQDLDDEALALLIRVVLEWERGRD